MNGGTEKAAFHAPHAEVTMTTTNDRHTHSCKGTKTAALLSPEPPTPSNEVSTAPTPLSSVCSHLYLLSAHFSLTPAKTCLIDCRQIWEEILTSAIRNAVSNSFYQLRIEGTANATWRMPHTHINACNVGCVTTRGCVEVLV